MSRQTLGLIDPAVENDINLGDHIISQAVQGVLRDRCGFERIVRVPSIHRLRPEHYRELESCDLIIVGGTNLLSSNMDEYNQWKIDLTDADRLGPVVLMGVGWWQYQRPPNAYTCELLRRVLHPGMLHSVRDSFTQRQLAAVGVTNVVNTSCPTVWNLTSDRLPCVPRQKGDEVVTTVTCYNRSPGADRAMLDVLQSHYRRVHLWPQGNEDRDYAATLGNGYTFLDGGLDAFDRFLDSRVQVDYVGTRLHAGIRALQHGLRSLVLALDNRAKEIARDIALPVVDRHDTRAVEDWIRTPRALSIRIPERQINAWIMQFAEVPCPW